MVDNKKKTASALIKTAAAISIAILTTGILFKTLHYPGGSIMTVTGLAGAAISLTAGAILFVINNKSSNNKD